MILLVHKLREEMILLWGGLLEREEPSIQLRYYLQSVSSAFISILPSATNHSEKAIPTPKIHQLNVSSCRISPMTILDNK